MTSSSRSVPQDPPIWTKMAWSSKSAASESTLRSAIQRHFVFERFSSSCSAFVCTVAGAGGFCAPAGASGYGTTTALVSSTSTRGGVADHGHTGRARESVLHHTHLRAIATDRELGDTSLLLGLYQRPWTRAPQSVGPNQRQ